MNEDKIIELFWNRSEKAIEESQKLYGRYLNYISFSILNSNEDAEEIVNDTYLKAWNTIPPKKPKPLKSFLGKIAKQLSINKLKSKTAQKRGGGEYELILDELSECISCGDNTDEEVDRILLTRILNSFLENQTEETRRIFVKRYWYMLSITQISNELSISESKVKSSLMRSRQKLKQMLIDEGVVI